MRRTPVATAAVAASLALCLTRAGAPPESRTGSALALHLTVETIAVDRRGTWSVGSDEADLFPGTMGVLKHSATLIARQATNAPREMVEMTVRATPDLAPDGRCTVRLHSEVTSVVSGVRVGKGQPGERKDAAMTLGPGE